MVILILGSTIILISIEDIQEMYKNPKSAIAVLINGTKIVSNNDNLYLGKVGAYHFFSNPESSMVIKDSDIERVILIN